VTLFLAFAEHCFTESEELLMLSACPYRNPEKLFPETGEIATLADQDQRFFSTLTNGSRIKTSRGDAQQEEIRH
jgi:hypothetical protein